MNDRFAGLEREARIESIPAGRAEVQRLHAIADRDLATAEELRDRNRDWALAISYNSLLQGCVALMAAYRYRAHGEAQHRTIVEFGRLALPEQESRLARLDRLRQRRHRTVYDVAGQVSAAEVEDALSLARELLPILKRAALDVLDRKRGSS